MYGLKWSIESNRYSMLISILVYNFLNAYVRNHEILYNED